MSISRTEATIAHRLEPLATPRARRVAGILCFAALTAISAKVAVPIPGTAVPFTFQPLAVLLAGALLGARLGSASQILYLTMGVAGLPVFAGAVAGPAYLLGPTGGYLVAYPLAAYLAGALSGRSTGRAFLGMIAGLTTIYAGGVSWLAVQTGWATALSLGLLPFVLADLVKVGMAVVVSARLAGRSRATFAA